MMSGEFFDAEAQAEFYPGVDPVVQRRFEQLQAQINEAQRTFLGSLSSESLKSIVGFVQSGDSGLLHSETKQRVNQLKQGVTSTQEMLQAPESQRTLNEVHMRIAQTDAFSYGASQEFRAGARLASFANSNEDPVLPYQFVTDIDGTVTRMEDYRHGILDPILPHSALVDPLGEDPNLYLPRLSELWQPMLREHPELYAQAGDIVPLRNGMGDLFLRHQRQGGALTALSTNTQPFIESVFKRLDVDMTRSDAKIVAVSTDAQHGSLAFEKDLVLQQTALERPKNMIVYLGDGSSDLVTLNSEARRIVGVYFALEGCTFAKQLAEAQKQDPSIIFFTYRTGEDIQRKMEEIMSVQAVLMAKQPNRRAVALVA